MKSQPPIRIRECRDPGPCADKPKPLHGIDNREEQRQDKNSYENQGLTLRKERIRLDAMWAQKGSATVEGRA